MGNKIITLPIMGEHRSEAEKRLAQNEPIVSSPESTAEAIARIELVQNDPNPSRRSTNGEPDNSLTLKQFQCGLELLQEAASEYLPDAH